MKDQSLVSLLVSWVGIGLVTFILGLAGLLGLPLYFLLLIPVSITVKVIGQLVVENDWHSYWWLWLGLLLIWALHFIGVLVPETGFDAVWYHLPVIARFLEQGKVTYLPDLYQSVNPLLTDMLFLLGYQWAGELGAKVVAFLLGLSLLLSSYFLGKKWLIYPWLQWLLITVSLIQPISWQVSSVYVDVGKAVWELGALYVLLSLSSLISQKQPNQWWRQIGIVGVLVGAAVATKAYSLVMIPVWGLMIWLNVPTFFKSKDRWLTVVIFGVGLLVVALPFYIFTTLTVGSPLYSLTIHVAKLDEIGGNASLVIYVLERMKTLIYSWWYISVEAKDYVSVLLLLLLPFFVNSFKELDKKINVQWLLLGIFSITQFGMWWLVPPTSTRYAIAGFISILLMLFMTFQQSMLKEKKRSWRWTIALMLVIVTSWHLAPRVGVAIRNSHYLRGEQTKQEFIEQFYDGNLNHHLQRWHRLPSTKLN
jgi:hypothetical protein